ncbi:MAG: dihydrofolate reductase [Alphaproteobacteria bacterium]
MTKNIHTSLIVAMAENRCIGLDNQMPWHISDDLKRFKSLTMNHPVIMGRKTFESILGYLKKPLPGRHNIIISRSGYETEHEASVHNTIAAAIKEATTIANSNNLDEIFIIGGAQIYSQAIEHANRIHLTKVHQSFSGDAFFPEIDDHWKETACDDHTDHTPPYSFITLER